MKHMYEYELSNGTFSVLLTDARYKEAMKIVRTMATDQGAELVAFRQVR